MKLIRTIFLFALLGLCGFSWPFSWMFATPNDQSPGTKAWLEKEIRIIKSKANNIDVNVLRLSLTAYINARKKGMASKQLLTVIDYSRPSFEKRLWVFDLKNNRTLFNTWVSHGRNSGNVNATSFSNSNGSLKSSIGVFVTGDSPYIGSKGYALRLRGLEHGINDNAYDRAVVFHGAWYVGANTVKKYGQVGRSWGCPAVETSLARPLIDAIKDDTVVVAYYPDRHWLNSSAYLTA
jgi:hypothetical protein